MKQSAQSLAEIERGLSDDACVGAASERPRGGSAHEFVVIIIGRGADDVWVELGNIRWGRDIRYP